MHTKTLLIATLCIAAGALCAQSGGWTAQSGWSARQGHTTVEFSGKLWLMGGRAVDRVAMNDVWSSPDGQQWTLEAANAPWSARTEHACVVYNNRIWVIGGKDGAQLNNDVWSSADGINWAQETAVAPWPARSEHTVNVFNGELWLMGGAPAGYNANGLGDVWTSSDGINWAQQADANWGPRFQHSAIVHNSELFVMGGQSGYLFKTDVWKYSTGGWVLCTDNAWSQVTFVPRASADAVSYNGEMFIIGGQHGGGPFGSHKTCGEVFSSTDGVSWNVVTTGFGWADRGLHSCAVFNNRIWILGGLARQWNGGLFGNGAPGEEVNDVWSSTDGMIWAEETVSGGFDEWEARAGHTSVVVNNRLWLIGGKKRLSSGTELPMNDVWSTSDGLTWTEEVSSAVWGARHGHSSALFNGLIYVLGGSDGTSLLADNWASADGINWSAVTSTGTKWSARERHKTVVFQNKLWVVGGFDGNYLNDVWSSTDGLNWTLETSAPGWSPRAGHSLTVFNNQLWLMGGGDNTANQNDVWSSSDGVNWTQVAAVAPWMIRNDHTCNAIKGRLWLTGGITTGYGVTGARDVWTSTDGVNWTQEPDAPWSGRGWHTADELGGKLILVGGRFHSIFTYAVPYPISDVWSLSIAPQITSVPVTNATAGTPYSYHITLDGSPSVLSASGLPGWLSLNGDTLDGTPGAADVGLSGVITIIATNAGGVAQQSFQIDVAGVAPGITSTPVTTAMAGVAYSYTVVTVGGIPAPVLSAGGLPGWLSFDVNSGLLSGTPGAADIGLSGTITITAANGAPPDVQQSFKIDVLGTPAQIVSSPVTSVVAGGMYNYTVVTLGLPAASYTCSALPQWLTFDANTGTLSGMPLPGETAPVTIIITADNGWGTDSQTFDILILEHAADGGNSDSAAGCVAQGVGTGHWLLLLLAVAGVAVCARLCTEA